MGTGEGEATRLTVANSSSQERRIDLVDADLETMGCVLEFLYTGDYFPHQLPNTQDLESDPSIPKLDETGDQLLKHARVYTLAETFVLPALRSLAFSKIHCVDSTSKGEIAYARYVYAHTNKDDHTIRAPVAKYWATQSLNLRTEAEVDPEFKQLCLDLPQFGYDVLSMFISHHVTYLYFLFCFGSEELTMADSPQQHVF
jgi:hypothetical protein